MTKNYIVFLRCDNEPVQNLGRGFRMPTDNLFLLINMVPMSHLQVKKHSKRTLEVLFPSGSICYFKLLIGPGCGKAWAHWRTLEQVCDKDILPLVPRSRLIPFSDLDSNLQKSLKNQNFVVCFIPLEKYQAENVDSAAGKSFSDKSRYFTTDDSGLDSSASLSTKYSSKSINEREISEIGNGKVEESRTENILSPSTGNRKTRKTKPIHRFGEGIAENCAFDLTMSYSDELVMGKERIKTDLENGAHPIREERASTSLKDSKMDLEAIKLKTEVGNNYTYEKRKESSGNEHIKKILKANEFFTNISLLVIPGGLRRSKSVDSMSEISPEKYDRSYLSSNISLPDLHELIFYRRYNRLSYSVDYFADAVSVCLKKGHSTHEISFWLPDKKPNGRIYCTTPICRKISAHKRKPSMARRDHLPQYDSKVVTKAPLTHRMNKAHRKRASQKTYDKRKHKNFSSKSDVTSDSFEILYKENKATRHILCGGSSDKTSRTTRSSSADKTPSRKYLHSRNERSTHDSIQTRLLDSYEVAYELHRIQRRMFCEIETPEIMRFILKPHTVTEVNCPYLCGYLFFFERLKNLVNAELSASSRLEDAVRIHRLFVQMAIACFKGRDAQSAYAIIGGLCSPMIPEYNKLWRHILNESEDVKHLSLLFKNCWNRKKWHGTRQHIPFFLDFITFLMDTLIKETPSILTVSEKKSAWDIFTKPKNFHRRNLNVRNWRIFAELKILSEGNLENVIEIIEECRKYYTYLDVSNSCRTDVTTEEYLLLQQYN